MRYLRLLYTFYKNALLEELEYRANFVVNVLTNLFWLFWAIVALQVYFSHTQTIGGWTFDEALLVVGMFNFANGFMEAFLRPNVGELGDHVRLGTLDLLLTKPINSQFLVSARKLSFWRITDMLLGLGVMAFALAQMNVALTWLNLVTFVAMAAAAGMMLYAISFMLSTSALWFVRIDNILEVFNAFYEAGRFPITVYRGAVRIFLTFVVPIAFMTTFPAAALIDKLEWSYALLAVAFGSALFVLSAWFWRFALRFYASASS
jgi:ABC-2 type transport system permease protein